jgi:predicted P-loop ATPase
MTSHLPFAAIAAAALNQSESLVAEWLPGGQKVGPEWTALNPTRADGKIGSFSVNLVTGAWGDFACDDKGGDLVSLYAYLFHYGDQGKAAVELAERFCIALPPLDKGRKRKAKAATPPPAAPAEPPKPKEPRTWWQPIWPAPEDAGEPPKANPNRGMPARIFTYRAADGRVIGYVCRFVTSGGGKDDIPLVFAQHAKSGKREWRWMAFAEEGRPLFGLDGAAAKPEASLLFVEGEKCREAAQELLPELAVMSWSGGCNGVGKADFISLSDRPVKKALLWPDCDAKREKLTKAEKEAGVDPASKPLLPVEKQPGTKAMLAVAERLHALGYMVWMIDVPAPGEKPDGWDIADAIAEGWTGATLTEYMRAGAVRWQPPESADAPPADHAETISTPSEADAGEREKRPFIPGLIWKDGEIKSCLSNIYQVLAFHPAWKGVIAFDEMALCTVKRKAPPYAEGRVGEWDAQDDTRTAMWLSRNFGFTPASVMVLEVVETLAKANAWHPVREWLRSLKWDGTKRLNGWLNKYLGAPVTPYTTRVAAWWLMGAVKRVMQPGVKFDYCLVLSGPQGKGKSTTFSILGGEWYGDTELDLQSKDAMSALRGKMIWEFPELGALARSEERRQKSFLSRQVDEYRPVYGRREIKAPRQVVFGGSTNEHEWNKDPTGGRRFWPIDCLIAVIDTEGLRSVRDQLFAEALVRIDAGERYWPIAEEQRQWFDLEQLRVEQQDSLLDAIHDWVYARVSDFSMHDVTADCLKLDASKVTPALQTRIGQALRKLGCTRVERRNGMIRFWYKPPVRNEASSTTGTPDWEGDDVPL